jgi:hypothetical protein
VAIVRRYSHFRRAHAALIAAYPRLGISFAAEFRLGDDELGFCITRKAGIVVATPRTLSAPQSGTPVVVG